MKRKDFGLQLQAVDSDTFDLAISPVRDEYGKIVSGVMLGPTMEQNIACLLMAEPGDYKLNPELGVGLRSALLDEDLLEYRHQIKQQCAMDGLSVKHLNLYDLKEFSIDAEYE